MKRLKYLSGIAGVLALCAILAPAASANHGVPTQYSGNPDCEFFGYSTITKFEGPGGLQAGASQAGITLTAVNIGAGTVSWTSTVAVDAVLVKGGPGGTLYEYPWDTFADSNLATNLGGLSHVEFCTDGQTEQEPSYDFTIVKAGVESSATAGTTVNFTITVTNTGNQTLSDFAVDDPNCDETRTGDNAGDTSFDPGNVWTYSCAMATTADMTSACNTATGTSTPTGPKSSEACIPLTPPGSNPPPGENPPPGGGQLPEEQLSGLASLRGPSGCVKQAFNARVTGRNIASVVFRVDGRVVKRISGERSVYSAKIRPNALGFGRHRVVARVTFTAESATAPRTLRLTFRRCARGTVEPRFTG